MKLPRQYVERHNAGGNYCGHDPQRPRFDLTKPASERTPGIIKTLTERLQGYYYNPALIPQLNFVNNSPRQQRSERREACLLILSCLLKFTDLSSLRVGIPTKEGFVPLTIKLLKDHVGISQSRFERALSDLVRSGLISSTQRCTVGDDGEYKGLAAIRCISKDLFGLFGLAVRLGHEMKAASHRLQVKARQWQTSLTQAVRNRSWQRFLTGSKKKQAKHKPESIRASEEANRQIQLIALGLRNKHPEWPKDRCFARAKELLYKRQA